MVDSNRDDKVSFEEVRAAVQRQTLLQVEPGRRTVVISLAEAQGLRALLHMRAARGEPLVPGSRASVALLHGATQLDASEGFAAGSEAQRTLVRQCVRYFDSELDYTPRELGFMLRALTEAPMAGRAEWFEAVRRCRRRQRRDWRSAPIARLFTTSDQYALLQEETVRRQIAARLRAKRMGASDFFGCCDYDGDGVLSCSELLGGLDYLGLQLASSLVFQLVAQLDRDADGLISRDEFLAVFGADDEADALRLGRMLDASDVRSSSGAADGSESGGGGGGGGGDEALGVRIKPIERPDMPAPPARGANVSGVAASGGGDGGVFGGISAEDAAAAAAAQRAAHSAAMATLREIPTASLEQVRVKAREANDQLVSVWTSRGTMARQRASLWAPSLDYNGGLFAGQNVEYFCVGHYGSASHEKPDGAVRLISLRDKARDRFKFSRGPWLDPCLQTLAPHPLHFRLIWHKAAGETPLFAWQAEPPNDNYVALGMVFTASAEQPDAAMMRCVHRSWLREATEPPTLLWDDRGTAGRAGSLWRVGGALGLVWATPGHEPPRGPFYELREHPFMLVLPEEAADEQPPQQQ